ncbi:hypothetical protein [Kineococcus arenarius]|uniref:hypothetical protein n=1 Tax=unclassified Kineococcus TaxID=2621656 RepID=UPI003D7DC8A0
MSTTPEHDPSAGDAVDEAYVARLVARADAVVDDLLSAAPAPERQHRRVMRRVEALACAYLHPASRHRSRPAVLELAVATAGELAALQGPGGLFDGDNLASPPDSSFTLNDLCLTLALCEDSGEPRSSELAAALRRIAERAMPPIRTGGVHTPNHRWEVCSALARWYALTGEGAYARRVEEWLAEGVDQQGDGMYSERSPLYAAAVTNPSLLVVADVLGRPGPLAAVRRNLEAFLPLVDDDGTVECVHSRRQDQHTDGFPGGAFAVQYRRFAVEEGRADFARAALLLQDAPGGDPTSDLAQTMARPSLTRPLPVAAPTPGPDRAVLAPSGLAVSRRGPQRLVVFGGSDQPTSPRIASGLANTATFLRFRHGAASVRAARLSTAFFGLGAFRSGTLEQAEGGWLLRQRLTAAYHQPLPAGARRDDGAYALQDEGRFWAAMDFSRRSRDEVHLDTRVLVREVRGGVDLHLAFEGAATDWSLELTLTHGARVEGAVEVRDGVHHLTSGTARVLAGADELTVGPVAPGGAGSPPVHHQGEQYDYLGGSHATTGPRLYVTGRTPGEHVVRIAGRSARG